MKHPTPETEKEIYRSNATGMEIVNAGFARRLERERDQLKTDLAYARDMIEELNSARDDKDSGGGE